MVLCALGTLAATAQEEDVISLLDIEGVASNSAAEAPRHDTAVRIKE